MLSKEVQCLQIYLRDSGVHHRVTSTYRNDPRSRHGSPGTNGNGLAIDAAGPQPSKDSQELANVFHAFYPVERSLHELIYAGPQVYYNIKNEHQVPKYAQSGHHDHVHIAVDKGVFIVYPKKEAIGVLNQPAVTIENTPSGLGYIIFAEDGGVFTYGDALFFGSGAADHDGPDIIPGDRVVSAHITKTGGGYRLLTEDGFVYCYGDATYHGGPNG